MPKFKVEIVETYRRYVEVEAEDADAAYQDIDDKIAEGEIDICLVMEKIISMTENCLCQKLKKITSNWR